MKKILIIAVVAAQVGLLIWMAGEREWVLRTGETVYLRTAPVDPEDPMRGDYVRLRYELATVPKKLCRDDVTTWFDANEAVYDAKVRDRRVYAGIQLNAEGVAELVSLSDRPPAEGLFLRGRANAIHLSTIEVRFGVEAFFMQQGKAREFEATMQNEKAGVPLNMELAVSPGGLAVLKGYRWEPLGIMVTPDRPLQRADTDRGAATRTGLRGVTVELKNHGSAPIAIVDGPDAHTWRLAPGLPRWRSGNAAGWAWVGEDRRLQKPRPGLVKVLQPGDVHRVHLDLTVPEWFVRKIEPGKPPGPAVSIESLNEDWTASFCIEYTPPSQTDCAELPEAGLIRHATLRSRVFNSRAGGD